MFNFYLYNELKVLFVLYLKDRGDFGRIWWLYLFGLYGIFLWKKSIKREKWEKKRKKLFIKLFMYFFKKY